MTTKVASPIDLLCDALNERGADCYVNVTRDMAWWKDAYGLRWMAKLNGDELDVIPLNRMTPARAVAVSLGNRPRTKLCRQACVGGDD